MPQYDVPLFIANRKWWLLPLLVWILVVGASFINHRNDIEKHSIQIAADGARNMFRMIVLTRAWNAQHGAVYAPVTDKLTPNPALEHPRRDITTTDGQQLTMINPAFMTRQLSELAESQNVSAFHITSLKPIRPENQADDWERVALQSFETGSKESIEVIAPHNRREARLRYMGPLPVIQACMPCHEKQGYKVGDIRGGISVTLALGDIFAAADPAKRESLFSHLAVLILITLSGWIVLNMLRHRWIVLGETNAALDVAKRAAETANVAKNAFLTNMSHELRTPLNAIVGHTHLLGKQLNSNEQRKYLNRIQTASSELLDMFTVMLDLTKAESGELKLAYTGFNLQAFGQQLFATLQTAAKAHQLTSTLHWQPDSATCWVHGDPQRIRQILIQYIDNAIKFSQRGNITLEICQTASTDKQTKINFTVTDQGIGIKQAHMDQLFGLFHQVDASPTRRHGGNGVGLYMCRQIAKLLGGEVGARSTPGQGSSFWFSIALDNARPEDNSTTNESCLSSEAVDNEIPPSSIPDNELLKTLEILLQDDDFSVANLWRNHTGQFHAALGDAAPGIAAAVNNFDFSAALEALENWRQSGTNTSATVHHP